jgi:hypothetical protein
MAEKNVVVSPTTVKYEGYFNANDLYRIITNFTTHRGYDPNDDIHEVKVTKKSRHIHVVMKPFKTYDSGAASAVIEVTLRMDTVVDVDVDLDGKKIQMQQGSVSVSIRGIILSKYEMDWATKGWSIFIRTIVDKFIYKRYREEHTEILRTDISNMRREVSSFLNLHKYIKDWKH